MRARIPPHCSGSRAIVVILRPVRWRIIASLVLTVVMLGLRHSFEAHSCDPAFVFICRVNGCSRTYSAIKAHLSRNHPNAPDPPPHNKDENTILSTEERTRLISTAAQNSVLTILLSVQLATDDCA